MQPGPLPTAKYPWGDASTPYDEIGGDAAVRRLVDNFYDIIETQSPVLRAMLPASTVVSRQKLYEYMSGWLGGPPLYTASRGHPRLRSRHVQFPIGRREADEWMRCMRIAMDQSEVAAEPAAYLDASLSPLADHMINR